MIDRVHTKYGKNFKGGAIYLLHDKQATTRKRVAWTQTRNISTNDPDAAWRVMAATAMDQDRLKKEAGIRPGGKPGKGPVLHMTLSWHAEEADELTRGEMLRAAYGAIRSIKLEDRQALIICHNDEPQPHLHILLNRVSPKDGRLPRDYKDYKKLSRWAKKYEKERGKIYCPQRVINEKARDRGEYVKAEGNKARHLLEMQQAINDNSAKKRLEQQHCREASIIKAEERRKRDYHTKTWAALQQAHKQRTAAIKEQAKRDIARIKMDIRNRFRPLWDQQYHTHQAAMRKFEQDEQRAIGRMKNAMKSIDFRSLLRRGATKQYENDDGRVKTISKAFEVLGNSGARLQSLKSQHKAQERDLEKRQKEQERAAAKERKAQQQRQLSENRQRYLKERNDILLAQSMDRAKIKAAWQEKGRRMRKELEQIQQQEKKQRLQPVNSQQPERQSQQETNVKQQPTNDNRQQPKKTNPSDLLPQEGSQQAAKQIDQFKQSDQYADRFAQRREKDRARELEDEHER